MRAGLVPASIVCAAVPGISVNQGLPECSTESEVQRVLGLAPGDPWQTIQMSDGLFTYPPHVHKQLQGRSQQLPEELPALGPGAGLFGVVF